MTGLVRIGLDYSRVESFLRMARVRNPQEVLEALQQMEWAALEVFNS